MVLQQQLLNVYNSVGYVKGWLRDAAIPFFNDINNVAKAKDVMLFYNREIPTIDHHVNLKNSFIHGLPIVADFTLDCYFFFAACKYFKQFNFPIQNLQSNCGLMKDLITVINNEKESVLQRGATKWEKKEILVLNNMKTAIELQMSNLNCNLYLTQTEQQYQIDSVTKVAEQSINSNSQKTDYTNYAIYGIIAIIVIVIFIKMVK